MDIKDQITKRPGWTVVAGTAAIASIVGGMTLASANGSNGQLPDTINLQDRATFEAPAERNSSIPMFSAPFVGMGVDSTLDSPLDGAGAASQPGIGAASASVASLVSTDSPDSATAGSSAGPASSQAQVGSSVDSASVQSFDSPESVATQGSTAGSFASAASVQSLDSPTADFAPLPSSTASVDSPDMPAPAATVAPDSADSPDSGQSAASVDSSVDSD